MKMSELEFRDESTRHGAVTAAAQCGRYTVRILQDMHAESPWDAWDGEPPYIQAGERLSDKPRTTADFPDVLDIARGMTRETLRVWIACLAAACKAEGDGLPECETPRGLYREALRESYSYEPESVALAAFDAARDCFYERNPLALYAAAFKARGWPYYETTSTGYSQGDYAELLFVATPAWFELTGAPLDSAASQLEHAARLWGFWAWGDVWGVSIETEEGDSVASCFGFYTDSPEDAKGQEESGMADFFSEALPPDWETDSAIGDAAIYAAV